MDDNDRSALVQQRIKKMLENKKKGANNRESGQLTKRLKSNLGEKVYGEQEEDIPKPSSSVRMRRPTSAMKAAESAKTITTNIAPKADIDVRPIITFVFDHGSKMKDLFKEKRLSKEDYHERITQDQLFLLRLIGMLREYAQQSWNDIVEKMCIAKINKLLSREELMRRCEESERRVGTMIQERLKNLERH